ncbi:MAG: hypothetical protein N2234_04655 [Planctomycetota bacterium]|nr:hypothetical protein [Planctomycetota bacterium]
MRYLLLLVFAAMVLGCASTTHTVHPAEKKPMSPNAVSHPVPYKEGIEKSLKMAGENRSEIEKFLKDAGGGFRKTAAYFLVAHMPPAALASLTAEELLSEFNLAFKAREEFPWGKKVSDEMFLHFVLPNFITQECYQRYRAYLYPLLKEALKGCKTMEEAALELNRWCGARFTYKHTQVRDQGVFENLKRGYGRCEEMMILYMAAARTVCLPVRHAYTPLWSTCDSNHAWVEVWCDGKWCYLGACEPAARLNEAWFTEPAKRAPLVLAVVFGRTERLEEGEEIYDAMERETVINTTKWYSDTARVKVKVTDGGKPVADKLVLFYVFNFGGLRPFAKAKTNKEGVAAITLGMGEFFVSSGDDKRFAIAKVKTEPNKEVLLELKIGEQKLEEGFFWLRYPSK